ncbi:N-acetylmuramoyl-L-alanine amidase [Polycladidibacter stylochi]|uniref:N-acetylmuramoyl-L-alanine amidase n=1 Tax=Polycladidibacter stylochi TaxID=1807766 RepID=UPI000AD029B4|nr:N-acetylmuramoyl-L-alanine amidase [Pseudovibrio stylochi]
MGKLRFVIPILLIMLSAFLMALMPFALSSHAYANTQQKITISNGRVAGDDNRTRFVLDMDGEAAFALSFLADPYRLIIDLAQVHFAIDKEIIADGRGLIRDWRFGAISAQRGRVVLDLSGPVVLDKSFLMPSVQGQPTRLVLDLVAGSRMQFLEQASEKYSIGRRAFTRLGLRAQDRENENVPNGAKPSLQGESSVEETASLPETAQTKPSQESALLGVAPKPIIVLDPGHGGIDSGARGAGGTLEKAVVLNFAKSLKKKLEQTGLYTVYLTRDHDRFIPLRGRVKIGHELKADLFISLHADSITEGASSTRGASIYTLSEKASDRMAAALARRENYSDIIGGVEVPVDEEEVTDILVELTRRETKNFSIHFARLAIAELESATRVITRPLRSAGFAVLKSNDVPSVLIELGFLSNAQDEAMLQTDGWRQRASDALTAAVNSFFAVRIAHDSHQN